MGDIGPLELMLFEAKRLPELGRPLGTGMREFKDSVSGIAQAHASPAAVEADGTDGGRA